MTTPVDSSSPFTGNINIAQQVPANSEEFSIRTMQDDLVALQKKATRSKEPVSEHPESEDIVSRQPRDLKPEQTSLDETLPQSSIPSAEKIAKPIRKEIIEVPLSTKFSDEKELPETKSAVYKIISTIVIVLIVSIIGIGVYFFLITRKSQPQPTASEVAQTVTETPAPTEQPAVITAPTEKYSQEKPNYLVLDLSTLSTDAIKKTISDTAVELKDKNGLLPYEFVAVDNNNNPIAFPIFATAAKLNLSPAILSGLGENFSIFFYNDTDNVRLALVIDTKKTNAALAEMLLKQEKTLINDVTFLFLDAKPEITTGIFKNSTSNSSARYVNLNSQMTLSIDYMITDSKFIVATSKNTMQAVLDKLSKQSTKTDTTSTDTTNNSSTGAIENSDFTEPNSSESN